MKILFLGTGTSTGIPVIGCNCDVCHSSNPRNQRLRSSILVQSETTTILVDSCPDLRAQALKHNLSHIDAIIYTHEHLDHVAGFDELRAFCWARKDKLPLYAGTGTLKQLKKMYAWAFDVSNTYQGYIRPEAHDHKGKTFRVGDIDITPVIVHHATVDCYGYVFTHQDRRFAYLPDVKSIPEASKPALRELTALAMDGLGLNSHPTHLSLAENITLMKELRPQHGLVTHSGHKLDIDKVGDILPPWMSCAYDGLELQV